MTPLAECMLILIAMNSTIWPGLIYVTMSNIADELKKLREQRETLS